MILAWLLLLTGLTISAVAIYYSVIGLTAIFSAAVIPIIIMGSALEVGKLVCASWLKANWERAPRFMKYYMITAVSVLMLITSMGIFGFLSKAHNDQNLVSGDVTSRIAIYDEKIKTAKDNIDANRKALKQMDEAVDQVMGRSSDEKGADKAVGIRRAQQKERVRLQSEIAAEQKTIAALSEERAPIAAEVRKVEAEVGPIKYIAKFLYGDHGADENMLERAVTWIIILIVIVFDPLAVIMLLAAQMTFGWYREQKESTWIDEQVEELNDSAFVADVGEKPTAEEVKQVEEPEIPYTILDEHHEPDYPDPKLEVTMVITPEESLNHIVASPAYPETDVYWPFPDATEPAEEPTPVTADSSEVIVEESTIQREARKYHIIPELAQELAKTTSFPENPKEGDVCLREDFKPARSFTFNGSQWVDTATYVIPEGRVKPNLTEVIESEDSKKKSYMIKDPTGSIQIKTRD